MANLALQKFRPGSSILPSSSIRPEPGKQAAELQIDTKKGFQHLHCSQMGPLQDIWVLQGPFLYVGPLFCLMHYAAIL